MMMGVSVAVAVHMLLADVVVVVVVVVVGGGGGGGGGEDVPTKAAITKAMPATR
jgi:hypothetical protein